MKKIKSLLLLVSISILLYSNQLSAQNSKHDTVDITTTYKLADESFKNGNYIEAEKYSLLSLSKSEQIHYKIGMAKSSALLGNLYCTTFNNKKALEYCYKAVHYYKELNDTTCLTFINTLDNIAAVFTQTGLYDKSIEAQLRVLNLCEKIKVNDLVIGANSNLANIYRTKRDFKKAIIYYEKAYNLAKISNDTISNLYVFYGLGDVYSATDFNKSLSYYQRFLNITKIINNPLYVSDGYLGIGNLYKSNKQYDKAIGYLNKALVCDNDETIVLTYLMLGESYYSKHRYDSAYSCFNRSLTLSKKIELRDKIMLNYKNLYMLDSIKGNLNGAFENYKLYNIYKDSIFNIENEKNIVATEMNFSFDKEKAVLKAKQYELNKVTDLNSKRQRDIIIGIVVLLILLVFVSVFIYKSYLGKNKAHKLIAYQKHLVDEKQKEIVDNITYAKRIQTSRLPSENYINENIKENFVLFQPKDIVSGDFYWATKKDNKFYLATADCTGHGVSGSMMSMLSISTLNEVVNHKNMTNTGDILNETRSQIIKSLNPKGNEGINDGMDCVLCRFDLNSRELQYSAANNSFYIVRNGEIIVCKANKMPVGLGIKTDSFTTNTIQLCDNDMVYMFTDGLPDQFSENNGKFKYKQFEQLLLSICNMDMAEQKNALNEAFNAWKGNAEQTDDVLVIGVKIG